MRSRSLGSVVRGLLPMASLLVAVPWACRDYHDSSTSTPGGASDGGMMPSDSRGGGGVGAVSGGDGGQRSGVAGSEPASAAGPSSGGSGDAGAGAANEGGLPHRAGAEAGGAAGAAGSSGVAGEGGGAPLPLEGLAPSSFNQLALWLEATSDACTLDVDQTVTHWTDASPYGNHALPRGSYAKPTFVDAAANGHAALRFQGSDADSNDFTSLVVPDAASLQFTTEDFAYLVVMRWSNAAAARQSNSSGSAVIIGKQSPNPPYPGVLMMANYPGLFAGVAASTRLAVQLQLGGAFAVSYTDGLNDNVFRLYVARRLGTDFALRINGVREGGSLLSPSLNLSGVDGPLFIGGNPTQALDGDIAELIALHGATSDTQLGQLENYLIAKYALR